MTTYKVTTELKTTWLMRVLRFFRVKKERVEFEIFLNYSLYNIGETLVARGTRLKVLKKEHDVGIFDNHLGYC